MTKSTIHRVSVHFGDCDPAGIVFFPNFARWMDQASLAFFMACGIPPWRELEKTRGIAGTPVLDVQTRFIKSATYGDVLDIETCVQEWSRKTFRHKHLVRRGDDILCEGLETRIFVVRDLAKPNGLRAVEIPTDIREACR